MVRDIRFLPVEDHYESGILSEFALSQVGGNRLIWSQSEATTDDYFYSELDRKIRQRTLGGNVQSIRTQGETACGTCSFAEAGRPCGEDSVADGFSAVTRPGMLHQQHIAGESTSTSAPMAEVDSRMTGLLCAASGLPKLGPQQTTRPGLFAQPSEALTA